MCVGCGGGGGVILHNKANKECNGGKRDYKYLFCIKWMLNNSINVLFVLDLNNIYCLFQIVSRETFIVLCISILSFLKNVTIAVYNYILTYFFFIQISLFFMFNLWIYSYNIHNFNQTILYYFLFIFHKYYTSFLLTYNYYYYIILLDNGIMP